MLISKAFKTEVVAATLMLILVASAFGDAAAARFPGGDLAQQISQYLPISGKL